METSTHIRPKTVSLIGKLLKPLTDEGLMSVAEYREVLANLKHLSVNGTPIPPIEHKLLNQREVAELLGISLANFKKLERDGQLHLPRRMIGSSVRYRNVDVVRFIMADDTSEEPATA